MTLRTLRIRFGAILLASVIMAGGFVSVAAAPLPASAGGFGTGAVSVKGPQSELIPGVTVTIFKGDCSGPAVWSTTTGSTPQAYGAFGIGLDVGTYCATTLTPPSPYKISAPLTFTMKEGPGNWVTLWMPADITVTGAVVAKNSYGDGVNGVTAFIQTGACGTSGPGVWRNTTATSRWSVGGFGIGLAVGPHCVTVEAVPAGFATPAPFTVNVVSPSPMWITIWLATTPITGATNTQIITDYYTAEKIIKFTCAACTGNTVVWAYGEDGSSELLVNEIGPYTGRNLVGLTDWQNVHYTSLEVTANSAWSLEIQDYRTITRVSNHAAGTGDDVVLFTSGGTIANISNTGSGYFSVWAMDRAGYVTLLTTSSGTSWVSEPIDSPSIMQVNSSGSWDITVG